MNKAPFMLLPLSLMLLTGPAQAESIHDAMRKCGAVQNSLKRLVCYDDIVNNLERYTGLEDLMSIPAPLPPGGGTAQAPAAPAPQQTTQAPTASASVQPAADDRFGLEYKRDPRNNEDKIFANITKLVKGRHDRFTITLDNGHVWKQSDSSVRMRLKEGEQVYVERGALGSFFLGKESLNSRLKVKRVK